MKIVAVVVTYNRKELLLENLNAILKQTHPVEKIILIDNNSTDGTFELLEKKGMLSNKKIIYNKLNKNIGGAGGFYEGMKIARKKECDWIWIMDDDTIPKNDCLEHFINALNILKNEKVSFLASNVIGIDGECMNTPIISENKGKNNLPEWSMYLKNGIVEISTATFVSLLINKQATKEIGLPFKDYFIWGDDTEYTIRLTKNFGKAYLIGNSTAIHKRKGSQSLSIYEEENLNRIKLYYYMVRNNYINTKIYYGKIKLLKYIIKWLLTCVKLFFSSNKYKFKKIMIINQGLFDAIFKRYKYKEFKNRFSS